MSISKTALALTIIGGLIALGAAIADVILIVKMLEQWRVVVSAVVLTSAAVGFGMGIINYLKNKAASVAASTVATPVAPNTGTSTPTNIPTT